jgi:hypothetical protein
MAHYLVRARVQGNLYELKRRLEVGDIRQYRPSGDEMTQCLRRARVDADGFATWEEQCFCSPPLKQERRDVLDDYFTDIQTQTVQEGAGWQQIENLPSLWEAN